MELEEKVRTGNSYLEEVISPLSLYLVERERRFCFKAIAIRK